MTSTTPPEIAAHVESLIPRFTLTRLLNADQAGRRFSLYGTIDSQLALLIAERAAFDTSSSTLTTFSLPGAPKAARPGAQQAAVVARNIATLLKGDTTPLEVSHMFF